MMIGPEQGKKRSGKAGKKKNKAKKAKRLAAEVDLGSPTASEDALASSVSAAPDPSEPVPSSGLARAADPQAVSPPDGASQLDRALPSNPIPDVGPQLLAWIDRVQERVDHLLTLVDPGLERPSAAPEDLATPEPDAPREPEAEAAPPAEAEAVSSSPHADRAVEDGDEPVTDAEADATSLAEAWARRQQTAEVAAVADDETPPAADDVEPFEPADAATVVDLEQLLDAAASEPEADDEPFEAVDARLTAILVARELIARGQSPADVRRRLREGYGVIDPDAVLARVAA